MEVTQKEVAMMSYLMKPKGVKGFWEDVHTFLTYIYQKYPQDMQAMEAEAQMRRDSVFNKFASAKGKGIRSLGLMPELLSQMLQSVYGRHYPISQRAFQREFFKRYPKLRITDKI